MAIKINTLVKMYEQSAKNSVKPEKQPSMPKKLLELPKVRQMKPYTCGSACLLSVLEYWGKFDGGEDKLVKKLKTDSNGTEPEDISRVSKELGLKCKVEYNFTIEKLRKELESGKTVIVGFQAWPKKNIQSYKDVFSEGHYAVVCGMDNSNIYFMDPSVCNNYGYLSLKDFQDRWHSLIGKGNDKKVYGVSIIISGKKPKTYPGPTKVK